MAVDENSEQTWAQGIESRVEAIEQHLGIGGDAGDAEGDNTEQNGGSE